MHSKKITISIALQSCQEKTFSSLEDLSTELESPSTAQLCKQQQQQQ